jgi:hypothetical protein
LTLAPDNRREGVVWQHGDVSIRRGRIVKRGIKVPCDDFDRRDGNGKGMTALKWFLLWMMLAIGTGMLVGRYCLSYYRLTRSGVPAYGQVITSKPHTQVEYAFVSNGNIYRGFGRNSDSNSDEIPVGATVSISYLPENPRENCLGDPKDLFSRELTGVLLRCLSFPTMITIALWYWQRERTYSSRSTA